MSDHPEEEVLDWNAVPSSAPTGPVAASKYAGPKFDVILPSGGKLDAHFARVALSDTKALIKVEGGALVHKALFALEESGRIGRKILIGSDDVVDAVGDRATVCLRDTGSLAGNVANGLRELANSEDPPNRVLIMTTDLPYISGKHVNDFIDACPDNVDFCVPLITEADFVERFPGSGATFAKLSEGNFTTGCLYMIKVRPFQNAMPKIEQVIANRKSVFKLAGLLGAGFSWKYLFKKLTVPEVVGKIEEITGCTGKAILDVPAELAFDIDDLVDYEYALRNR